MPKDEHKKIRSVEINYNDSILGFSFFDKDNSLLWKIGYTHPSINVKRVTLEENEIIIGVVAKLDGIHNYTDLQFQIARLKKGNEKRWEK